MLIANWFGISPWIIIFSLMGMIVLRETIWPGKMTPEERAVLESFLHGDEDEESDDEEWDPDEYVRMGAW